MFQEAGRLVYGAKPVPGASFTDLDLRRLRNYLTDVLGDEATPLADEVGAWSDLLTNLELMIEFEGVLTPTVDGLLIFGRTPTRFLPQAGVRALAYDGESPDYATRADEGLSGPLSPLLALGGEIVEPGLVNQALAFIDRVTSRTASLEGGRRIDRDAYPLPALREALVNALVHRDYAIIGADVSVTVFDRSVEIRSPGRLPNSATVAAVRSGFRYARNQTLVNVMRDYGYVDFRGMGVRAKMIPSMRAHNGTEPELIAGDHDFTVRLLLAH